MPDQDPLLGRTIKEHQFLEVLGRRGVGTVYKARHVLLDEQRAIKVIGGEFATNEAFVDRFVREARVLHKVATDQPEEALKHIVRLHEFWREEGMLFMALEWLQGESLRQRLNARGRLPADEALKIAREIAVGLRVAHQVGIVHRDVSPDNVQLVPTRFGDESVKVMDFGIAKAIEETRTGGTGFFLANLQYASPEQCYGGTIDFRADVYSLGVVLYQMVAGRPPFQATSPAGFLRQHVYDRPERPSVYAPTGAVPAFLDTLILKTLAKNRDERHPSMDELIRALDAVSSETRPAKPVKGSSEWGQRLNPGDTFAERYVIRGRLGEGGMGVVYWATDNALGEPVALKMLSSNIASDPLSVERFKREVILARRVTHRNACRIHDAGDFRNIPFVSMELIEGRSLKTVLQEEHRLSLERGLNIAQQILDGLSAAHDVGIVHRDLKPSNIMIGNGDRAVIMDFGLSVAADSLRITKVGHIVGSPQYMSPEQVRGDRVDARSDVYAMGIVLYRIFTGELPFGGSRAEMYMAHLMTTPPRPSTRVPEIAGPLETIILKALEKDPRHRYASARDLATALHELDRSALPSLGGGTLPVLPEADADESSTKDAAQLLGLPWSPRSSVGPKPGSESPSAVGTSAPSGGVDQPGASTLPLSPLTPPSGRPGVPTEENEGGSKAKKTPT
jgi:serine/threonine protein kinase